MDHGCYIAAYLVGDLQLQLDKIIQAGLQIFGYQRYDMFGQERSYRDDTGYFECVVPKRGGRARGVDLRDVTVLYEHLSEPLLNNLSHSGRVHHHSQRIIVERNFNGQLSKKKHCLHWTSTNDEPSYTGL